jgi:hypothetical protein
VRVITNYWRQPDDQEIRQGYRLCHDCAEWYHPIAMATKRRCIWCKEELDSVLARDPVRVWLDKANTAIDHHGRRMGEGMTARRLREEFGWDPEALAHAMQHAFQNGCPDCEQPFALYGRHELTIDIRDRSKDPHFPFNTWFLCMQCNRAKATLSADDYCTRKAMQKRHQRRRKVLDGRPLIGPLFGDAFVDPRLTEAEGA